MDTKTFEGDGVDVAIHSRGCEISLDVGRQAELSKLLIRALSTMDPQKTPQWATWLSDKLNNMPEEATKGWYAVRDK
jgi:hypothetical protein